MAEENTSGSFYNEELGMLINHPYGSDAYWKVFYAEFTKRHCEALGDFATAKHIEDARNKNKLWEI